MPVSLEVAKVFQWQVMKVSFYKDNWCPGDRNLKTLGCLNVLRELMLERTCPASLHIVRNAGNNTPWNIVGRASPVFQAPIPSNGFLPHFVFQIYGAVIGGHLSAFPSDIRRFGGAVLEATIALHRTVCAKFLPTAVKFYYGFNLRDMSCLVQVGTSKKKFSQGGV